jgi:hypothetical protein
LEWWLLASLRHEIVREFVEALEERRPRPLSRFQDKRLASSTDFHFLVVEVKFLRNADGLTIAALEDFGDFHGDLRTYMRIYASADSFNSAERAAVHKSRRFAARRCFCDDAVASSPR